MRNVVVYPTKDEGLIVHEIPWGNTFIADGLSAELKCTEDQVEWMKKFITELPNMEQAEYGNSPLLTRVWTNVMRRSQNDELDFLLPIEERPKVSEELKADASDLFNWNEQLQF